VNHGKSIPNDRLVVGLAVGDQPTVPHDERGTGQTNLGQQPPDSKVGSNDAMVTVEITKDRWNPYRGARGAPRRSAETFLN
jgi:hypothetical protein